MKTSKHQVRLNGKQKHPAKQAANARPRGAAAAEPSGETNRSNGCKPVAQIMHAPLFYVECEKWTQSETEAGPYGARDLRSKYHVTSNIMAPQVFKGDFLFCWGFRPKDGDLVVAELVDERIIFGICTVINRRRGCYRLTVNDPDWPDFMLTQDNCGEVSSVCEIVRYSPSRLAVLSAAQDRKIKEKLAKEGFTVKSLAAARLTTSGASALN